MAPQRLRIALRAGHEAFRCKAAAESWQAAQRHASDGPYSLSSATFELQ
jgi:hypothetical protein